MTDFTPQVLLDSYAKDCFEQSWRFGGYLRTLVAMESAGVATVLAEAEKAADGGLYAVGFLAYEAAGAVNPYLPSLPPVEGLPLAWFAIFSERVAVAAGHGLPEACSHNLDLAPAVDQADHAAVVGRIHRAIANGESYQINYTFPLQGRYDGDPLKLYRRLLDGQRPPFGAFIDTGRHRIISASPELFFSVKDGIITTRPMKGTAPRGRFAAEDAALAEQLASSEKDRAENLMIVDLLRNDLGQVALTGSVQVNRLFELERYPTVHQLTSTITARVADGASLTGVLRALFPCGSVTGAPKRKSMERICELEESARGVYCGTIGCLAPGGEATFSVAIRTLVHDSETGRIAMGVGSGITWGSDADAEYIECLAKSAFLDSRQPVRLLESLLLENGSYPRLARHLARLQWSASRLGHDFDRGTVEKALLAHGTGLTGRHKVRLLLSHNGEVNIESAPLTQMPQPLKLAISAQPVDPADLSLYLKTEARQRYDAARAEHPDADEVLLCNNRGELTEGSYHNLVLRLEGKLVTPPIQCGLLPGVMREELLATGKISEQTVFVADLGRAEEIWLINGVRGWQRAELA
jgi:para-aminobenzoate synthetase / 4-amino-4-deoxychorismate lyase